MKEAESEIATSVTLPLDILIQIFRFLSYNSRGKAARVCRSWKAAADCKAMWGNCELRLRSGIPNEHSERSIVKRGIKRFEAFIMEPGVNEFLHRVPDLEFLRITGCCKKKKYLNILKSTPNHVDRLKAKFEVYGQPIQLSAEDVYRIMSSIPSPIPDLECQHNIDHVLKTFTTGMKKLKELSVEGCVHYSENGSDIETGHVVGEDLDQSASLQKLGFRHARHFTEGTFDYISRTFVNLTSMSLDHCEMAAGKGLEYLIRLKKLECLRIVGPLGITDAWLAYISQISSLKSLELRYYVHITDGGLQLISRLRNLTTLTIDHCSRIADAAWNHLNHMPNLRELSLCGSNISDTGLCNLAAGDLMLTKLDISWCSYVNDQGLLNICHSSFNLHDLNISGCRNITDRSVKCVIETFSELQVLTVASCPNVEVRSGKLISDTLPQRENSNVQATAITHDSKLTPADPFLDHLIIAIKLYL